MISDGDLMRLKPGTAKHNAELRRVEKAIDMSLVWLKLYARSGNVDSFEQHNSDLEQHLTELWQLTSIK